MSETEWLTCVDPEPMLELLRGNASGRKMRLFACACCRRIWHLLHDKRSRKAVECSEQFADGHIDKEQLSAARKEADDARWARALSYREALTDKKRRIHYAANAAMLVASATGNATKLFHRMRLAASAALGAELLETGSSSLHNCQLLREIFGNPFRWTVVEPTILAWNDSIIPRLAKSIYDDQAFDLLPILADALEDAGCIDADMLLHCRLPGGHIRGCWVIDDLLGRE
jgi:hypothetical protein